MKSKEQLPQVVALPADNIAGLIQRIRGQQVILDSDLAQLYGVPTFRFNEAVKRNAERFPPDFMFRLTPDEWRVLTSQFAMSKLGRGGRRTLPSAFTSQRALMAANTLTLPKACLKILSVVGRRSCGATRSGKKSGWLWLRGSVALPCSASFKEPLRPFDPPNLQSAIRNPQSGNPRREIGFHTIKRATAN